MNILIILYLVIIIILFYKSQTKNINDTLSIINKNY